MGSIILIAIKRDALEEEADALRLRIDALSLGPSWIVRLRYSDAKVVEK